MDDAVLVAIVSLFGTVCGSYFANRKTQALIGYRIEQLEKKVDKHNTVIERTYDLEKHTAILEERMSEIERGEKNGTK